MEPPAKTYGIAEGSCPSGSALPLATVIRGGECDDNQASKLPSVPDWISGYQRDWLRPDVITGLTRGCRCHSEGNGVRHDRGAARTGRTLYRLLADGHLRGARHIAAAECKHNHDPRHSHGGGPGRSRSQWRCGSPADRDRHFSARCWWERCLCLLRSCGSAAS